MKKTKALGILAALAHETRLDVFRRLVRVGTDGLPAGVLAAALGVPAATLSFHLKELKNAGVVECRREGRSVVYSPDFRAMNDLVAFLSAHCCENSRSSRPVAPGVSRTDSEPTDSTSGKRAAAGRT